MSEEITEGFLLDLVIKRRAGKFDVADVKFAIDHPDIVRWARDNKSDLEGLMDGTFAAVKRGTYQAYVQENVEVLLEDPEGAAMFLSPAGADSLRSAYSEVDDLDFWIRVPSR